MAILVVGATGATGRLLVEQLLDRGCEVRAVVRSIEKLPAAVREHHHLSLIQASVLDLSDAELAQHISGCDSAVSCLGHNLTFKGVFGSPRRLVTEATRRLCQAITATRSDQASTPFKLVLMNTAGNSNRDLNESISWAEKSVIGLIRILVPPHADNEQAADFLRLQIGQDCPLIQWVAVRPDTLINEDQVTEIEAYPSPTRSAIFRPGKTSRINVARFMAELIIDNDLWAQWQGKMPVIYNRGAGSL